MKVIKILVPIHTLPNVTSVVTSFFDNFLPVLKEKASIRMVWFVYQPDKLKISTINFGSDVKVLDVHNYKNALEVIKQEKPDLVFASATYSFMDYAFSLASKHLGISVISGFYSDLTFKRDRSKLIRSYTGRFLQSSIPTDTDQEEKQFMRRGRFYVYKYLFVLKTQIAIRMHLFDILRNFIRIFSNVFQSEKTFTFDPAFANTLHWLEGEGLLEQLTRSGFKKSSLVITGNPMYDSVFKKSQNSESSKSKDNVIKVLLITDALYEHGFYSLDQRNKMVKLTISEFSKYKNEISLTVKIHPSSESIKEYRNLIDKIDSTIPIYQKEDVIPFISNADIVIAFSSVTTALLYSLILKKPIIICNYFDIYKDPFIEDNIAFECKSPDLLCSLILQISKSNLAKDKIDDFIKKYLYKVDGKSSERVCDAILALVKQNKN